MLANGLGFLDLRNGAFQWVWLEMHHSVTSYHFSKN